MPDIWSQQLCVHVLVDVVPVSPVFVTCDPPVTTPICVTCVRSQVMVDGPPS